MANVYFDISIEDKPAGRIVFKLFDQVVPKTARNFRELATGQHGFGYKGSRFHNVLPGFALMGGDFTEGTGKGGKSIYEEPFPDENFDLKHSRPYLLSTVYTAREDNSSLFLITTRAASWLDGAHVVFGDVREGLPTLRAIERTGSPSGTALSPVTIVDCGIV